jgi:hypothetical protein
MSELEAHLSAFWSPASPSGRGTHRLEQRRARAVLNPEAGKVPVAPLRPPQPKHARVALFVLADAGAAGDRQEGHSGRGFILRPY